MPRLLARGLPLLALFAAAAIVFVITVPSRGPTVGTEPPALVVPLDTASPIEVVQGFADAMNAGDVDGVLATLDPGVAVVFLPGVAGMAEPTVDELRDALGRYGALDQTLAIERCDESSSPLTVRTDLRTLQAPLTGGTVLDCRMVYSSSFARRIGLEESTRLFMRFDVGDSGIAAMYLSPVVEIDEE